MADSTNLTQMSEVIQRLTVPHVDFILPGDMISAARLRKFESLDSIFVSGGTESIGMLERTGTDRVANQSTS